MQIASRQIAMPTYRSSIVFLAYTYGRDFTCLCGVTRPCVTPLASTRGDVCTRDDHARLCKARAWLGGPCLSRIYYEFGTVFQGIRIPEREFVASDTSHVARSCAKRNHSVYLKSLHVSLAAIFRENVPVD